MNIAEAFCQFSEKNIKSSTAAQEYIAKRQWNEETVKLWRLGHIEQNRLLELKAFLIDNKISAQDLEDNYYTFKGDKSFLFNRIIFPIFDSFGEAVGVSGRCLDDSKPKYFNTSFNKMESLFGLNLTKHAIRKENTVYVFEGYADVITAYQNGMQNVVGCMGVVLSQDQLSLLSHYCENIVLVFDNDAGGEKGRKLFNKKKLDTDFDSLWKDDSVKIYRAILNKHKDPDEYIKIEGSGKLKEFLNSCMMDNKMQKLLRGV
jgi:DNA primase